MAKRKIDEYSKGLLTRVPCHYPGCKAKSAPVSNYCKKHGAIMRRKYEGNQEPIR